LFQDRKGENKEVPVPSGLVSSLHAEFERSHLS
jgi:hypothetical protein